MRIVAIDTKPTALLTSRQQNTTCVRIVQFSFVYDTETDEIVYADHILRVPCDISTTYIHGITKEQSDNGEDLWMSMSNFLR